MRLAIIAVRSNKFRSFMTILGVMIGVGAVILVNTIMDGFNEYTQSSIDKIGSNVMYINKWAPGTDFDNLTDEQRRRPNIRMTEAEAEQTPEDRLQNGRRNSYESMVTKFEQAERESKKGKE